MTKKRKYRRHLTANEETNLACLLSTRKALEEKRDEILREQKPLKDRLKKDLYLRHKKGRCWYAHLDRLYHKHEVRRENYHVRKSSGRPLKRIKKSKGPVETFQTTRSVRFKNRLALR